MGRTKTQKIQSPYLGVNWDSRIQKWRATLTHEKKTVPLGVYDTDLEAVKARDLYILKNKINKPTQVIKPKTT